MNRPRDIAGWVLPLLVLVVSLAVVLAPSAGLPVTDLQVALAAFCGSAAVVALLVSLSR